MHQLLLARDWRSPLDSAETKPARRGDHSSRSRIAPGLEQPTRGSQRRGLANSPYSGRAGPPLLFGLAPRGVFRAPDVATRAVGSYPTFSPLPNALDRWRRVFGFPKTCRSGASITGGLFSVALSVAASPRRTFARRRARPPGVTRRVALYHEAVRPQGSPSAVRPRDRSPDFPPTHPACAEQAGDHPAHPPSIIIPHRAATERTPSGIEGGQTRLLPSRMGRNIRLTSSGPWYRFAA